MRVKTELKITIFGGLRVEIDRQPVGLPKSRKTRALLAYLAVQPEGATRARLCDLLFAQTNDPRASLRWSVSRLRKIIGNCVRSTDNDRLVLAGDQGLRVDTRELESCIDALEHGVVPEAARSLESSLTGAFLDDLAVSDSPDYEAWRTSATNWAHRRRQRLLELLIERSSDPAELLQLSEHWVAIDPQNEAGWAAMVTALGESGQVAQAKRVYDTSLAQLVRDQVPLQGSLLNAYQQQVSPESPLQSADGNFRPVLAVHACRSVNAADPLVEVGKRLCDAVFHAASYNKACSVAARSRGYTLNQQDGQLRQDSYVIDSGIELSLTGTFAASGNSLSIQLELNELAGGICIWTWRYRLALTTPQEIYEAVLSFLSARFEIDIPLALFVTAQRKSIGNRSRWDQYYLALSQIYGADGYQPDAALRELTRLISFDPNMGPALAVAAWVRTTHPDFNQHSGNVAETASMARRAFSLCPDDAFIISLCAVSIAVTDKDLEMSLRMAKRALLFNPYSTMALAANGIIYHYLGENEQALGFFDRAESAIDTEPLTFIYSAYSAMALYELDRIDEAVRAAKAACARNPTFVPALRALTVCLVRAGELEAATECATRLAALDSSEYVEFFRHHSAYRDESMIDRMCADLMAAGLPLR